MNSFTKSFIGSLSACFTLIIIVLFSYPGANKFSCIIGAVLLAAITCTCYRRLPFFSNGGAWVLLGAGTVAIIGTIVNTYYYTTYSGGSLCNPVLENWDSFYEWNAAKFNAFGIEPPEGVHSRNGMAYLVAGLIAVFGCNVQIPLLFNSLCYLLTIITVGATCFEITKNKRTAFYGMLATALMGYLAAQSTLIIKDTPVTLLMAIISLIFVRWSGRLKASQIEIATLAAAITALAFLRINFMFMVGVGALVFGIERGKFNWKFLIPAILAIAGYVLAACILPKIPEVSNVAMGNAETVVIVDEGTAAWDDMLGGYTVMPFYKKLLWLPLSIVVQFLIPFPWGCERHIIFGPTSALAHCGFFWYYAGAFILYWIFAYVRKSPAALTRLVGWGVLLTIITAYISAGRISRYCLPYLPMLLPAAAVVLTECVKRKSLHIWLIIFTAMLIPTLLICYKLQSAWL